MNPTHRSQRRILITAAITLLIPCVGYAQSISPDQIRQIRGKSVLVEKDLEAVATFVNEQLIAMMNAADRGNLNVLNETTALVTENAKSTATHSEETMKQYSLRFNTAIRDGYPRVQNFINTLTNQEMTQQLQLALLIVMAQIDDPELISTLIRQFDHPAVMIRYWAAKGLAGPAIIQFVKELDPENQTYKDIQKALNNQIENETDPLVLSLIARVAALSQKTDAGPMLKNCIHKRLALYKAWSVDQEYVDLDILRLCTGLVVSPEFEQKEAERLELIKSATELFSAGYYRYAKGIQHDIGQGKAVSLFTPQSENDLQTLLVDGEIELTRTASRFDTSVQLSGSRFLKLLQSQSTNLDRAYEIVMQLLNKTFAMFPDQTGPDPKYFDPLPDPPAELVQRAINRSQIQDKLIKTEF